MKYIRPNYKNEAVKTNDIICESPYTVAHISKKDPTTGETYTATQITVNASKLFGDSQF
ncbi:MAG: hypothetical protein IJX02_04500 [Clostridia bacterium]|nr:hypothetical protein [Clostridia bacterium]